jgi:hypothetical protein
MLTQRLAGQENPKLEPHRVFGEMAPNAIGRKFEEKKLKKS